MQKHRLAATIDSNLYHVHWILASEKDISLGK